LKSTESAGNRQQYSLEDKQFNETNPHCSPNSITSGAYGLIDFVDN
jgi:hypothetical protein